MRSLRSPHFLTTKYLLYHPCTNCNLGNAPDPNTEVLAGYYSRYTEHKVPEELIAKGRWPKYFKGPGDSVSINECKDISKQSLLPYFYIGEKSGYSLEETQTLLLDYTCGDE